MHLLNAGVLLLLCHLQGGEAVSDPQCTLSTPPGGAQASCFNAPPLTVLYTPNTQLNATMTHTLCMRLCTYNGFTFGSLSPNTGELPPSANCGCGNTTTPGVPPAPANSCGFPCPGNASEACGGSSGFYTLIASTCQGPLPPSPVGPSLPPGRACSQPSSSAFPFCNTILSLPTRVSDLIGSLALAEVGPLLTGIQPLQGVTAIPRLGLPAWSWGIDMAHGITAAPPGCQQCVGGKCPTLWPSGPALGASFNASAWAAMGRATAREMRGLNNAQWSKEGGIDGLIAWGPVINLAREGRWGRIQEVLFEDSFAMGVFARTWTRAAQESPDDPRYLLTATTLKHLAVYSLEDYTDAEGHYWSRENSNFNVSAFDLADSYLGHFKVGFSGVGVGGGGAAMVMQSMNSLGGIPNTANGPLIQTLHTWDPNVVVITDGWNLIDWMLQPYDPHAYDGGGHNYCPFHAPPCSKEEGVAAALQAGVALALGREYYRSLQDAVVLGVVGVESVVAALRQALPLRFKLGVMDPAEGQPFLGIGLEAVGSAENGAINALAAREGLVLARNDGGLLPFTPPTTTQQAQGPAASTPPSLLLLGFPGNSTASLLGNYYNPTALCPDGTLGCFPTLLQALAAFDPGVAFFPGCLNASYCPPDLVAAAVGAVAGASRVVLVVGLDEGEEREQHDRHELGLPPSQGAFARAVGAAAAAHSIPCASVLVHGGPLALDDTLFAPEGGFTGGSGGGCGSAILDAFYPGPLGGPAIAGALFGAFSPGGKYPYTTFTTNYTTAVAFPDHRVAEIGRTYRYHNASTSPGGAPQFEFGTGTSYATFALAWGTPPPEQPLVVQAANLTSLVLPPFTLANTHATWGGDEVVMVYIRAEEATVNSTGTLPFLPVKQLCAFLRVTLGPGEARPVQLEAPRGALELTDVDGGRELRTGRYALWVTRGDTRASGDDLQLEVVVV